MAAVCDAALASDSAELRAASTVGEICELLARGVYGGGALDHTRFHIPKFDKAEIEAALPFLTIDKQSGSIKFSP